MKKKLFESIIMWYKTGLISFNMVMLAIFMTPLFFIFPQKDLPGFLSFLVIFFIGGILLIINMRMENTAKKYFIEIPKEKDNQCEDYLLLTKEGEIFKMDNKPIWSPGGKILKITSRGKWQVDKFGCNINKPSFTIKTSVKDILRKNVDGKIEIVFFLKDSFNPLLIYKLYQENNIMIIDDSLYIDEVLMTLIRKENEDNEKFKYFDKMTSNQLLVERFMTDVIIPTSYMPNIENYAIYQKK